MAPAFDFSDRMAARHGEVAIHDWEKNGFVEVDHYGTGAKEDLNFGFFEDAKHHQAYPVIRVPSYILHGNQDETVAVQRSLEAKKLYGDRIELDIVDDDHSLVVSADRALQAAIRFAKGLNLRPRAEPANPQQALDQLKTDPRFDG